MPFFFSSGMAMFSRQLLSRIDPPRKISYRREEEEEYARGVDEGVEGGGGGDW